MQAVDEGVTRGAAVHLRLLGGFAIDLDGTQSNALTAKKAQVLLAFLALQPDTAVAREKVAALLWPDTPVEFARTNLRQCLSVLRKALSCPSGLITQGTNIQLNSYVLTSDVYRFEVLLDQETISSFEHAVLLYQGKFLDGFAAEEVPIQNWLDLERGRLHERLVVTLHKLIDFYHLNNDTDSEEIAAHKLVKADSLDEKGHRTLMRCYAEKGRVTAAVRQYKQCKHVLNEILGVAPQAKTVLLFKQLTDTPNTDLLQSLRKAGQGTNHGHDHNQDEDPIADPKTEPLAIPPTPYSKFSKTKSSKHRIWLILTVIIALGILTRWNFPSVDPKTIEDSAKSSAVGTNNPSIAVLPFTNLTPDSLQTYFSDGLSEDLITDLSRLSGLTVIARASSFNYRDASPDVLHIANELGVGYILQGSVRKIEERVRINAQLVDIGTASNIWADRYDRQFSDVLLLQDEITRTIVSALAVNLTRDEQKILDRSLKIHPDAYDLLLRGLGPIRRINKNGSEEARALFKRAISIDPSYARAYANLALSYAQDTNFGFTDDPKTSLKLGFEAAERAAQLDPSSPQLYFALSILHLGNDDQPAAIEAAKRAIKTDPNYADGYGTLAQAYMFNGQLDESLAAITKAKRLNPQFTFSYLWVEGQVHFLAQRHDEALTILEQITQRNPEFASGRLLLISEYGHLGKIEDAAWEISEFLTLKPNFSVEQERSIAMHRLQNHKNYYIEGLIKAGLTK